MIKIALVGNIAAGKSTVEAVLKDLGFNVLDTDCVCHNLLNQSSKIAVTFKSFDVFEQGVISREKLGKLVFSDELLKKKLENILYPLVEQEIRAFFEMNKSEKFVFVAIPLLFEAGMEKLFDRILFIYTDDAIRLERLMKRNGYSKEYAEVRMNAQVSQDEKVKKSDFIIYNNSTLEDLKSTVKYLIGQIR